MLDIRRDEAYASAVLIQLVKSLGGRPDYGIESTDDIARASALASRLALFGREQLRVADELESNLRRVADDRVRHQLQKLLIARVRNIRRLDGERPSALGKREIAKIMRRHLRISQYRVDETDRGMMVRNRPRPTALRHPL